MDHFHLIIVTGMSGAGKAMPSRYWKISAISASTISRRS